MQDRSSDFIPNKFPRGLEETRVQCRVNAMRGARFLTGFEVLESCRRGSVLSPSLLRELERKVSKAGAMIRGKGREERGKDIGRLVESQIKHSNLKQKITKLSHRRGNGAAATVGVFKRE
ncbi:hypothetical protein F2Q69_00021962 [Brassica cretica]|uniref:Uncharacterized protein n=1 Tax=Brassica cretica TaxID=69181 RepID=A0A8S9QEU8_BRACR|nr:hypothetical protein F2Q69_00021962 [Brassica cretica]